MARRVPLPTTQLPHHIPQKPIWFFTLSKFLASAFFMTIPFCCSKSLGLRLNEIFSKVDLSGISKSKIDPTSSTWLSIHKCEIIFLYQIFFLFDRYKVFKSCRKIRTKSDLQNKALILSKQNHLTFLWFFSMPIRLMRWFWKYKIKLKGKKTVFKKQKAI